MSAVATDAEAWNAETVTAQCANTGPAAIAAGAVGVKAGTSRLGSIAGFKDCRSASDFQAPSRYGSVNFRAMPVARARSQWESGMNSADFAFDAADYLADRLRGHFEDRYEHSANLCESEIERILLAALMAVMPTVIDIETIFSSRGGSVSEGHFDAIAKFPRAVITAVVPQAVIKPYRVDFLVEMRGVSGARLSVVVECDGHDFHERTPKQAARDRKRDRALQALGYRVMRFTGSEICRDPFGCAREVRYVYLDFEAAEAELIDPKFGAGCRKLIAQSKAEDGVRP